MQAIYTIIQLSRKEPTEKVELGNIIAPNIIEAERKFLEETGWETTDPDKYLFVKHPICR